ncbi:unnamed protein product [Owenia fusiformis]|uniref:Uncharacterized protein n=1 Tax=Owenia fusiformis TaxID=6347 RepID=A0A8J1XXG0_OWEFU|nr:unnamed protein product [Owenia fusiformis]
MAARKPGCHKSIQTDREDTSAEINMASSIELDSIARMVEASFLVETAQSLPVTPTHGEIRSHTYHQRPRSNSYSSSNILPGLSRYNSGSSLHSDPGDLTVTPQSPNYRRPQRPHSAETYRRNRSAPIKISGQRKKQDYYDIEDRQYEAFIRRASDCVDSVSIALTAQQITQSTAFSCDSSRNNSNSECSLYSDILHNEALLSHDSERNNELMQKDHRATRIKHLETNICDKVQSDISNDREQYIKQAQVDKVNKSLLHGNLRDSGSIAHHSIDRHRPMQHNNCSSVIHDTQSTGFILGDYSLAEQIHSLGNPDSTASAERAQLDQRGNLHFMIHATDGLFEPNNKSLQINTNSPNYNASSNKSKPAEVTLKKITCLDSYVNIDSPNEEPSTGSSLCNIDDVNVSKYTDWQYSEHPYGHIPSCNRGIINRPPEDLAGYSSENSDDIRLDNTKPLNNLSESVDTKNQFDFNQLDEDLCKDNIGFNLNDIEGDIINIDDIITFKEGEFTREVLETLAQLDDGTIDLRKGSESSEASSTSPIVTDHGKIEINTQSIISDGKGNDAISERQTIDVNTQDQSESSVNYTAEKTQVHLSSGSNQIENSRVSSNEKTCVDVPVEGPLTSMNDRKPDVITGAAGTSLVSATEFESTIDALCSKNNSDGTILIQLDSAIAQSDITVQAHSNNTKVQSSAQSDSITAQSNACASHTSYSTSSNLLPAQSASAVIPSDSAVEAKDDTVLTLLTNQSQSLAQSDCVISTCLTNQAQSTEKAVIYSNSTSRKTENLSISPTNSVRISSTETSGKLADQQPSSCQYPNSPVNNSEVQSEKIIHGENPHGFLINSTPDCIVNQLERCGLSDKFNDSNILLQSTTFYDISPQKNSIRENINKTNSALLMSTNIDQFCKEKSDNLILGENIDTSNNVTSLEAIHVSQQHINRPIIDKLTSDRNDIQVVTIDAVNNQEDVIHLGLSNVNIKETSNISKSIIQCNPNSANTEEKIMNCKTNDSVSHVSTMEDGLENLEQCNSDNHASSLCNDNTVLTQDVNMTSNNVSVTSHDVSMASSDITLPLSSESFNISTRDSIKSASTSDSINLASVVTIDSLNVGSTNDSVNSASTTDSLNGSEFSVDTVIFVSPQSNNCTSKNSLENRDCSGIDTTIDNRENNETIPDSVDHENDYTADPKQVDGSETDSICIDLYENPLHSGVSDSSINTFASPDRSIDSGSLARASQDVDTTLEKENICKDFRGSKRGLDPLAQNKDTTIRDCTYTDNSIDNIIADLNENENIEEQLKCALDMCQADAKSNKVNPPCNIAISRLQHRQKSLTPVPEGSTDDLESVASTATADSKHDIHTTGEDINNETTQTKPTCTSQDNVNSLEEDGIIKARLLCHYGDKDITYQDEASRNCSPNSQVTHNASDITDDNMQSSDNSQDLHIIEEILDSNGLKFINFAKEYFNSHIRDTGNSVLKTLYKRRQSGELSYDEMTRYMTSHIIPTSHVPLHYPDSISSAISIFKDLHKILKSDLKSEHTICTLKHIIGQGINRVELRDEIYCQLLRFTTDMPDKGGKHRLWFLMALSVVSFVPSRTLLKYVVCHIKAHMQNQGQIGHYATYCLEHLKLTVHNQRKMPPSTAEIEAVKSRNPIVCRVYFLDDKTKALSIDPSDTAGDMVLKVAKKIGLKTSYGWELYDSTPKHMRHIQSNEHLADIVSQWEQEGFSTSHTCKHHSVHVTDSPSKSFGFEEAKFVFCKRIFQPLGVTLEDPLEVNLMYAQAVYNVVKLDAYQASEDLALRLAGLQAQVTLGPYEEDKSFRYDDVEQYLCPRLVSCGKHRNLSRDIERSHKWLAAGKSKLDAQTDYLQLMDQFPLYGSTMFLVNYKGEWAYGRETFIAISIDSIRFVSIQDRSLIHVYSYDEIEKIVIDDLKEILTIEIKSEIETCQKCYMFEIDAKDDFKDLIAAYSPQHISWRSIHPVKLSEDRFQLSDDIEEIRKVLIRSKILQKPYEEDLGFIRSTLKRWTVPDPRFHRTQFDKISMPGASNVRLSHFKPPFWSSSKTEMRQSLMLFESQELEDVAVKMFNSSLIYAGIETGGLESKDHAVVIQTLISKCLENSQLCNEFFLQLIKQTTAQPEPVGAVSANYWQMLCLLTCVMVPANKDILTYLRLHLRLTATDTNCTDGKYAAYCLQCLHRIVAKGNRRHPPSSHEIVFVTARKPIEETIHFIDGQKRIMEFDSATTSGEILKQVKAKMGVKGDSHGFSVYEVCADVERNMRPDDKLADAMYQYERWTDNGKAGKLRFTLKKRLFVDPIINTQDPKECDLVHHQLVSDIFEQKIPLSKSDAVQLSALRAQAEHGDISLSDTCDYYSVMRILPRSLRETIDTSEIEAIHQSLEGTEPRKAVLSFIDLLSKSWPLRGAAVFEIKQTDYSKVPNNVWLAVNQTGLHLMEIKGAKVYKSIPYSIISSHRASLQGLCITVKTTKKESKHEFMTSQGSQISHLIDDYKAVVGSTRLKDGTAASLASVSLSSSASSCTPEFAINKL